MVFGEEILFLLEDPSDSQGISGILLRFLGVDEKGIKMKGSFPKLWENYGNNIMGPVLYDEENCFQVNYFNEQAKLIWLTKVS